VVICPDFADSQPLAILGLKGVSVKYKIALQKTNEGYAVSVPGLPGCWSQGATESEALSNIRDAIREYLAAREELLKGTVVREVDVAS
jgi:predicted RNase H-like HicB family nuclease